MSEYVDDLEFIDEEERKSYQKSTELTKEQLHRFYQFVQEQPSWKAPINGKACRLAFEMMEDTGLRITELLHVKKKDIDFESNVILVTHPKSEKDCKCASWEYKDLVSRKKKLVSSDKNCPRCHGRGRWKRPQRTTFTPRFAPKLLEYLQSIVDDEALLFPVHRKTMWQWGKKAGDEAGIKITQYKDEKEIKGIFLHLFRSLCAKRMVIDANDEPYKIELIATKLRHSINSGIVTYRYTKIDINYLREWEARKYN
jgi:integrase